MLELVFEYGAGLAVRAEGFVSWAAHAMRDVTAGRDEGKRFARAVRALPSGRRHAMSARSSTAAPLYPVPRRRPASPAISLLQTARKDLSEAAESVVPASRYVAAHLAALRAAAAVLAARAEPGAKTRGRPRSVWVLLPAAEPALREWAAFFAAGAGKRAAAEAGLPRAVTVYEADELLHDAEIFVSLVETTLGIAGQQMLSVAG